MNNFSIKPFQLKVIKPWGYEIIITPPDSPVTGKIFHLNKGCRNSLQYHDLKQEALALLMGEAGLIIEDEGGKLQEIKMEPLKGYYIKPYQKHRFVGVTECDILETSTKEEGETVRLEDDYSRGTETEENRSQRKDGGVYTG